MHEQSVFPELYVIGDSISIHYGPPLENCLEGKWRYSRLVGSGEATNNMDVAAGANAGDSRRVLSLLSDKVLSPSFAPDLILVNCGLHDIKTDPATRKTQIPPEEYRQNLTALASLLSTRACLFAWVQTTHCSDEIHNTREGLTFLRYASDAAAFDRIARSVMAEMQIPFVPLGDYTRTLGPDHLLFCDHVHFNDWVREKQASFLASSILRLSATGGGGLTGMIEDTKNRPTSP